MSTFPVLTVTTFLPLVQARLQSTSLRQLRVLLAASCATVTLAALPESGRPSEGCTCALVAM